MESCDRGIMYPRRKAISQQKQNRFDLCQCFILPHLAPLKVNFISSTMMFFSLRHLHGKLNSKGSTTDVNVLNNSWLWETLKQVAHFGHIALITSLLNTNETLAKSSFLPFKHTSAWADVEI